LDKEEPNKDEEENEEDILNYEQRLMQAKLEKLNSNLRTSVQRMKDIITDTKTLESKEF